MWMGSNISVLKRAQDARNRIAMANCARQCPTTITYFEKYHTWKMLGQPSNTCQESPPALEILLIPMCDSGLPQFHSFCYETPWPQTLLLGSFGMNQPTSNQDDLQRRKLPRTQKWNKCDRYAALKARNIRGIKVFVKRCVCHTVSFSSGFALAKHISRFPDILKLKGQREARGTNWFGKTYAKYVHPRYMLIPSALVAWGVGMFATAGRCHFRFRGILSQT